MINFVRPIDAYLQRAVTLEPLRDFWQQGTGNTPFEIDFGVISFWTNARSALRYAAEDVMRSIESPEIVTTSGSRYLSSCVSEVFGTGDIRVNRENGGELYVSDFGYKPQDVSSNIKIFDDAWSLDIEFARKFIQDGGMHYLTSLPKVLGLPFGGMLFSNYSRQKTLGNLLENDRTDIENLMASEIVNLSKIHSVNSYNRKLLLGNLLAPEGFTDFFRDSVSSSGVSIAKAPELFDEVKFKYLLQSYGIRGTAFFHNQAIILPSHYLLDAKSLEFVASTALMAYKQSLI